MSRLDGHAFQTLSQQDGLVHDSVKAILQDRHNGVWFATEGGVTRYVSRRTPPIAFIEGVVADRRHGAVDEAHVPVSQTLVVYDGTGERLQDIGGRDIQAVCLGGHGRLAGPTAAHRFCPFPSADRSRASRVRRHSIRTYLTGVGVPVPLPVPNPRLWPPRCAAPRP